MSIQHNFKPSVQVAGTTGNDSDINLTVPTARDWDLQSVRVDFIAASTVGGNSTDTRQIELQIRSTADDILYSRLAGAVQPKNSTFHYNFANDEVNSTVVDSFNTISANMPRFILSAGYDVRVFDNLTRGTTVDDLTVRVFVQERIRATT